MNLNVIFLSSLDKNALNIVFYTIKAIKFCDFYFRTSGTRTPFENGHLFWHILHVLRRH